MIDIVTRIYIFRTRQWVEYFFFFFWNACWRSLYFNGSLRWLTGGRKQIARQIILVIDRFTQRIINNSARFRPFEHSILFSLHAQCFDFSKNRYFISSSSPILLSNVQRGAGEGNRGIALFTLATVFAEKTVSDKIRMIFFFFFLMKIKFLFKVVAFVETNSTKRFETNRVRSLKRILKTFSIRLSMLDSIEGENMELRLVLGIISGSNEKSRKFGKFDRQLLTWFRVIFRETYLRFECTHINARTDIDRHSISQFGRGHISRKRNNFVNRRCDPSKTRSKEKRAPPKCR